MSPHIIYITDKQIHVKLIPLGQKQWNVDIQL